MDIKEYIENIPMWAKKKNSLKAVREFLANIEMKKNKKVRIIHVAGTNGKGSTCAYISNILKDMNYKVGTFISPHLIRINERIMINMEEISDLEFNDIALYIKALSEDLSMKTFYAPTYFEFLFYMAIKYFYDNEVDFIVLETGLGGLYDITNSIQKKDLCILTSISRDHEKYLGNTISEIVSQKAGILRPDIELIYDDNTAEVGKEVYKNAELIKVKAVERLSDFNLYIKLGSYEKELQKLNIEYKINNARLSILAVKKLYDLKLIEKFDLKNIIKSILNTRWKGRMQEIEKDIYIDGAHNEGAILEFSKTCRRLCIQNKKKAVLLLSIVDDKDIEAMISNLKCIESYISRIYLAKMNNYRAADISKMKDILNKIINVQIKEYDSIKTAFKYIKNEKEDTEMVFILGSLYIFSEIFDIKNNNVGGLNAEF